jgi:hypothetical protein
MANKNNYQQFLRQNKKRNLPSLYQERSATRFLPITVCRKAINFFSTRMDEQTSFFSNRIDVQLTFSPKIYKNLAFS